MNRERTYILAGSNGLKLILMDFLQTAFASQDINWWIVTGLDDSN